MSFTVTATQTAAKANGMAGWLYVLTGTASGAAQPGTTFTSQAVLNTSFTPGFTGSWVPGAYIGGSATYTAEPSSPYLYSVASGLRYLMMADTTPTTASTPVTLGSSAGGTVDGFVLCEIKSNGTITSDASSPGQLTFVSAQAITSPSFTPPAGSLLVLMVGSNGAAGTTTVSVSDTSGSGMTWTEQVKANGSSKGYAGIWTAQVPGTTILNPPGIPPGFLSPASIRFSYRPPVIPPVPHTGLLAGASAVLGGFRGVNRTGLPLTYYAELPGPVVKPLSLGATGPSDPFTGRAAASGVFAGQKQAPAALNAAAAASGAFAGSDLGGAGFASQAAIAATTAGRKVALGSFTGRAAAKAAIAGSFTPPFAVGILTASDTRLGGPS